MQTSSVWVFESSLLWHQQNNTDEHFIGLCTYYEDNMYAYKFPNDTVDIITFWVSLDNPLISEIVLVRLFSKGDSVTR